MTKHTDPLGLTTLNQLLQKVTHLKDADLHAAEAIIDQLLARREPEKPKVPKEELAALLDQLKEIQPIKNQTLELNFQVKVNYDISLDAPVECGYIPYEDEPAVRITPKFTVSGNTPIEKALAGHLILDDYDLEFVLEQNLKSDGLTEINKQFSQYEKQAEKVAEKYGLELDELSRLLQESYEKKERRIKPGRRKPVKRIR